MTALAEVKMSHGLYSMNGEEVAQLIPTIYNNTIEEYKNDERKCLIQILVPNIATMAKIEKLLNGADTSIRFTKNDSDFKLVFRDYDIHIIINNDYTSGTVIKHYKDRMFNYKTIAMILYGKMDIVVEEILFEEFIRDSKLFGMLVRN